MYVKINLYFLKVLFFTHAKKKPNQIYILLPQVWRDRMVKIEFAMFIHSSPIVAIVIFVPLFTSSSCPKSRTILVVREREREVIIIIHSIEFSEYTFFFNVFHSFASDLINISIKSFNYKNKL